MWEWTKGNSTYVCERVYDPLTGIPKTVRVKISKLTAAGRKEAQKRLLEKISANAPKTQFKLSEIIELYEKEAIKTLRYSTFKRNECALNSAMKVIGDPYIDRITAGYIRQKLLDTGKSIVWMNETLKRLKTVFMWAYRNDYLPDRSLFDKLQKFQDRTKHDRIENKFLEREELNALTDAMDLERWKLLTMFLALSGLRFGEAAGLNNDDFTSQYISITKSWSDNFKTLSEPKTASSVREVFIQPELAECIKKIRVCMMRQRMMYGYEDQGFFFTGIDGGRIGNAAYNKYLKEIAKQTVPEKNVTAHTLRHTMTSLFAEVGVPLDVIARRLGHETSDLTRQIYLHITKSRKIKDNAEIESVKLFG